MRMVRSPRAHAAPVSLSPSQQGVIDDPAPIVLAVGAPGSGKTTMAIEAIASAVAAGRFTSSEVLLLAPTRRAAATLRERLTARLGGTTSQPLARTVASLAMAILREQAHADSEPAPRLLNGPEQDVVLADLVAGWEQGQGRVPRWPEYVVPALGTRGFRQELRDLFMRAAELDLSPEQLQQLAQQHQRPVWSAAATAMAEYDEVTALRGINPTVGAAYDPAALVPAALDALSGQLAQALSRRVRYLVVDDAQELTIPGRALVARLNQLGATALLLGDPDASVQTFRGADPGGWLTLPGSRHVLTESFRLPAAIQAADARVVGHIGVQGAAEHRCRDADPGRAGGDHAGPGKQHSGLIDDAEARSGADSTTAEPSAAGTVEVHVLRSYAQEASYLASRLRQEHLLGGRPWSDMAIVVRGGARTASLRRALAGEGVPVAVSATSIPVRDESAVRPLLTLMAMSLRVAAALDRSEEPVVDAGEVVELLTSPYGGANPVSVRRLRRALRRIELDEGGGRHSDQLIVDAVLHPHSLSGLGRIGDAAAQVAAMLAAGVAAAQHEGASAEEVLWAIWDASAVAPTWQQQAVADGAALGTRRHRDLDAVLELFDAASRFVERVPGASPRLFLDHVQDQELAADSLVARAPSHESVAILTPAAAAGRQWPVVMVASVQEGRWPDQRVRGTLLGSSELVDVVTGRAGTWRARQAAVLHDETRLFHVAISRACERLIVTAVRADDEQPSPFLDMVVPLPADCVSLREFTDVDRPLTLGATVASYRRALESGDPAITAQAISGLSRLTRARVPGADPGQWWTMMAPTSSGPLSADGTVRVSPSKVDGFVTCQLKWLLQSSGGDGPSQGSADVGVVIHAIAAETPDETIDEAALQQRLDQLWPWAGIRPGWFGDHRLAAARAMISRYVAYVHSLADDPARWRRVAAEEWMKYVLGSATVSGTVDRLEVRQDGALRIIDLKTGGIPRGKDMEQHPQLGLYALGVEVGAFATFGTTLGGAGLLRLGDNAPMKNAPVELPGLDQPGPGGPDVGATGPDVTDSDATEPRPPQPHPNQPDLGWARSLLAETAAGMAGSHFLAMAGVGCGTCPVMTSCPIGPDGKGARL